MVQLLLPTREPCSSVGSLVGVRLLSEDVRQDAVGPFNSGLFSLDLTEPSALCPDLFGKPVAVGVHLPDEYKHRQKDGDQDG